MIDPCIQALLEEPIGNRAWQPADDLQAKIASAEAIEAARRASKRWLPEGKRPSTTAETRAAQRALQEAQIDLEDAIEAAGGARGTQGGRLQ